LDAAGLDQVQLLGYDHNWDAPGYPDTLLDDPAAAGALAGIAWHCYAGDPTAQTAIHDDHPDEEQWMTECTGLRGGRFAEDLEFASSRLLVESVRGWARGVLFWNVALDPAGGPHTGGCPDCRGVLTVDAATGTVSRNVEYDVLALAGRAARPGAVRIGSTTDTAGITTIAWHDPDGTHALFAHNGGTRARVVTVELDGPVVSLMLPRGSVTSLVFWVGPFAGDGPVGWTGDRPEDPWRCAAAPDDERLSRDVTAPGAPQQTRRWSLIGPASSSPRPVSGPATSSRR